MKIIKKLFCILISLLILLPAVMPATVFAKSTEVESNYRIISYQISWSDLDNYADGGRSGLEILLRSSIPEGVTYNLKTLERKVILTLSFEFETAEDYRKKVMALCGSDTVVICSFEEEALLTESGKAMDYLDFIFEDEEYGTPEGDEGVAEDDNSSYLFDLRPMMTVTANTLCIDGVEYTIDDCVNIRPKPGDGEQIKADYLEIYTEAKKNGKFKRTITVCIYDDTNDKAKDYFTKLFKKSGKVKTEQISGYELTLQVSFNGYGIKDIISETASCLGCTVLQTEDLYPIDSKNVWSVNQEYYDLEAVLNNTDAFDYTFVYPENYKNVEVFGGEYYPVENSINSSCGVIVYGCQKRFCFDEIYVFTDVSSIFGRIERTIRLRVSGDIAAYYHDMIKNQIAERLPKNSVMTIGEDKDGEYYEICFSSYSAKKVAKFTNDVLDSSGNLDIKRGFWGFFNQITESISFGDILSSMSSSKSVSIEYKLIPTVVLKNKMEDIEGDYKFKGTSVIWEASDNNDIEIYYSGVNILNIAILIVALAAALLLIIVIVKKGKNKRKSTSQE
jgi:hypothetical protein